MEPGQRTVRAAPTPNEPFRVIEGEGLPPQDPLVGRTIDGRYEVERVLGEGGMGLVYRGRHIVLNKALAIKVLRPEVSRDEEIIGRFRQEAQSASSIGNQHIIDISDFGTLPDGSTYFIMEMLEGQDLTKLIETASPLSPKRIVHIAKQLCDALSAAHEAGIVHRDLKPDNIYLVRRGSDSDFVKVLDFGIAKVGGASSKMTRAGQVFGTPHYMSPEQCGGAGVDHRTDIYAIGTILYEMLVGRTPFDADNLMGILTKHLFEAPVPPSQHRPDCPPALEAIILRCIAKTQDERYANCRELLEDLVRLEGTLPLATVPSGAQHPASPGQNSAQSFTSGRVDVLPAVAAPAPGGAKRWLVLGLVTVLLAAGGAGIFMSQRTDPPARHARAPIATLRTPQEPRESDSHPVALATVQLVTEPAGAEIWSADELLGQTPLAIPRPAAGETLAIELRATNYVTRRVTLSSHTLASELRFSLEAEHASGTTRPGGTTRPNGTPMAVEPAMDAPTMEHHTPDVIDPWATPR
jgi:hypothetical protein